MAVAWKIIFQLKMFLYIVNGFVKTKYTYIRVHFNACMKNAHYHVLFNFFLNDFNFPGNLKCLLQS